MVFCPILIYHISNKQTNKDTKWRCKTMMKKTLFLCIFATLFTVIALKTADSVFSQKDNGIVSVFSVADTDDNVSDRKHI